jgi:hypothetical protein
MTTSIINDENACSPQITKTTIIIIVVVVVDCTFFLLHIGCIFSLLISAPQYAANYSPTENGDVLDIVVHKNIRLSCVIVSDILDSDHLPIMFHILDHARTKQISKPLDKFTDWGRFQSLASNLISPRVEIKSGVETDKAACAFTTSFTSAYRLSTSKITLSELNKDIPGLDRELHDPEKGT